MHWYSLSNSNQLLTVESPQPATTQYYAYAVKTQAIMLG